MSLSPSCDERLLQKSDTGVVEDVVVVVVAAEEEEDEEEVVVVVVVVVVEGVALDEVVILRPFVTHDDVDDHTRRDKVGLRAQQNEGESKNVASIKRKGKRKKDNYRSISRRYDKN